MKVGQRNYFHGLITFVVLAVFTVTVAADGRRSGLVLEEIIVTAEKRSENINEMPIAISAYQGETLELTGVDSMLDLAKLSPSLQMGANDVQTHITIRGVGSEIANIGSEPGVTVSQDGVFFARNLLFNTDFLDVERVEVLRGPQGTISGRNATGGAVNVISNLPTDSFEGSVDLTFGNFDRIAVTGVVSGPIAGDVLGRLAISSDNADGWLENTASGEEYEDRENFHARASLLAAISEDIEALLIFDAAVDKSSPQSTFAVGRARADQPWPGELFGVSGLDVDDREFATNQPRRYEKEQYGVTVKLTWDISEATRVVSTSAYWTVDTRGDNDNDGTILSITEFPDNQWDVWQFSQELTLTSDITDRLDLILGGLYLRETSEEAISFVADFLGLPPGAIFNDVKQKLTSYAVYSQLRYEVTDRLKVSAGIRYTKDDKDYFEESLFFGLVTAGGDDDSWDAWTPRIAIDYALNESTLLFASISRGFKAGGFNTFNFNPVDVFEPEFIINYEAGVKAELFDGRARVALTGFYSDYTDLQQTIITLDTGVPPTPALDVLNASEATIYGLEFEADALVTDNFHIGFSTTYLHAEFDELESIDNIFPELGTRDLSGNRLPRAPEWQFNLNGEYILAINDKMNLALRANYSWQDDAFFTFYNHDLVRQDAYGLLDVNATLQSSDGRWEIGMYAHNALDEEYFSNLTTLAFVPGAPSSNGSIGAPRTYGIKLGYNF